MPSLPRLAAVLLAGLVTLSHAVHPVEVRGQDFVDTVTQKRFTIVGVDYQPGGQAGYDPNSGRDPLSNGTTCLRDAILLQRLGVNTIRVYNIDPSVNHDECVSIFNAAGMYMVLDVNSPLGGESLNRDDPKSSYHVGYLTRIFGIVEAFKNYPNTLAFFVANEVMNDVGTSKENPPYIRAVQRDLKNYIAKHATRKIPVGYSAADVREILEDTWEYFQCNINGTDDASRSDFFGLNSYSWCGGEATYATAGYNLLVDMFDNSTLPVFFSEYGCNKVMPRVFNEVQSLYGTEMTALSGGLVYEYSQEEANYGLVVVNANSTITLRSDYKSLQGQFNKLNLTLIQSTTASATQVTPPKCDGSLISSSGFSKDFNIPSTPSDAVDVIKNGISKPNNGKLISVTKTAMPVAVYDVNGGEITGLTLTLVSNDGTNTPSGETTAAGEQASSTGGSGSSKPNSAGMVNPGQFLSAISIVFTMAVMVL